jgi:hypothetical protein
MRPPSSPRAKTTVPVTSTASSTNIVGGTVSNESRPAAASAAGTAIQTTTPTVAFTSKPRDTRATATRNAAATATERSTIETAKPGGAFM